MVCVLLAAATAAAAAETESQSSYIVHVASEHAPWPSHPRLLARAYTSFLRDSLPASVARPAPRLLYSYAHAATGFAARLTERQAAHLASQPSVLSVAADGIRQLHTTLTPSFLRLSASSGLLPASNGATNVVIGVINTGIYPKDRAAFADDPSMPPPPSSFRGGCVSTPSFNAPPTATKSSLAPSSSMKVTRLRMATGLMRRRIPGRRLTATATGRTPPPPPLAWRWRAPPSTTMRKARRSAWPSARTLPPTRCAGQMDARTLTS